MAHLSRRTVLGLVFALGACKSSEGTEKILITLRDRACACPDRACADKVMKDLTEVTKPLVEKYPRKMDMPHDLMVMLEQRIADVSRCVRQVQDRLPLK